MHIMRNQDRSAFIGELKPRGNNESKTPDASFLIEKKSSKVDGYDINYLSSDRSKQILNLTPIKNEIKDKATDLYNRKLLGEQGKLSPTIQCRTVDSHNKSSDDKIITQNENQHQYSAYTHKPCKPIKREDVKVISKTVHFKPPGSAKKEKEKEEVEKTDTKKSSEEREFTFGTQENIRKNNVKGSGQEAGDYTLSKEQLEEMEAKLTRRVSNSGFNQKKKEGYLNIVSTTVYPSPYQDRNKVSIEGNREREIRKKTALQKNIRSLSQILLKKKKNSNQKTDENSKNEPVNLRALIESHSKNKDRYAIHNFFSKSPSKKFIQLTMAMISSRNPFSENQIFTRGMRNEKGGVVDLNTPNIAVHRRYMVQNINKNMKKPGKKKQQQAITYTYKHRELAAKIIQQWWKNIMLLFKTAYNKIVKIQSYFRRYWIRAFILPILHTNKFLQLFVTFASNPFKRDAFRKIIKYLAYKYSESIRLGKIAIIQRNLRRFLLKTNSRRKKITEASSRLQKVYLPFLKKLMNNFTKFSNGRYKLCNGVEKLSKSLRLINTRIALLHWKHQVAKKKNFKKMLEKLYEGYSNNKLISQMSILRLKIHKWSTKIDDILKQKFGVEKFLNFLDWKTKFILLRGFYKIKLKAYPKMFRRYLETFNRMKKAILTKWRQRHFKYVIQNLGKFRSSSWLKLNFEKFIRAIKTAMRKNVMKSTKMFTLRRDLIARNKFLNAFFLKKQYNTLKKNFARWKLLSRAQNIVNKNIDIVEGCSLLVTIVKLKLLKKGNKLIDYLKRKRGKQLRRKKLLIHYMQKIPQFVRSLLFRGFFKWRKHIFSSRRTAVEKSFLKKYMNKLIKKEDMRKIGRILQIYFKKWKDEMKQGQTKFVGILANAVQLIKINWIKKTLKEPFIKLRKAKYIPMCKTFLKKTVPIIQKKLLMKFEKLINGFHLLAFKKANQKNSCQIVLRIAKRYHSSKKYFMKWKGHTRVNHQLSIDILDFISLLKSSIRHNIFRRLIKPSLVRRSKKTSDPRSYFYQVKVKRSLKFLILMKDQKENCQGHFLVQLIFFKWTKALKDIRNHLAIAEQFLNNVKLIQKKINSKWKKYAFTILTTNKRKYDNLNKLINKISKRKPTNSFPLSSLFQKWKYAKLAFPFRMKKTLDDYAAYLRKTNVIKPLVGILKDCAKRNSIIKKVSCRKIIWLFNSYLNLTRRKAKRPAVLAQIANHADLKLFLIMQLCFRKWRRITSKDKINRAAKVIQSFVLNHKNAASGTKIEKRQQIQRKNPRGLLPLVASVINDYNLKRHILFLHWKKKALVDLYNKSARIIQKFFQYLQFKSASTHRKLNTLKIHKGIILFQALFAKKLMKFPFDKIIQEAKRRIIIRFILFLRNKKLKNFRFAFNRIKRYVEIKYCVLNAYAKKIQNKFRGISARYKIGRLYSQILFRRKILAMIVDKELRNKYSKFKLWRLIFLTDKQEEASRAVQNFLKKGRHPQNSKTNSEQAWLVKTLFWDYFILKKLKPCLKAFILSEKFRRAFLFTKIHLIKKVKQKFKDSISINIQQKLLFTVRKCEKNKLISYFNKLRKKVCSTKIKEKLIEIVKNEDNKLKKLMILSLRKWKAGLQKVITRDSKILNAITALERIRRRQLINKGFFGIKMKKMKNCVIKFLKRRFFRKMCVKVEKVRLVKSLSSLLVQGDISMFKQHQSIFIQKVYQVFIYKILLEKVFKTLHKRMTSEMNSQKVLLLSYLVSKRQYSEVSKHTLHHIPKIVNLSYKENNLHKLMERRNLQIVKGAAGKPGKKDCSHYYYLIPALIQVIHRLVYRKFSFFLKFLMRQKKCYHFIQRLLSLERKLSHMQFAFRKIRSYITDSAKSILLLKKFQQLIGKVISMWIRKSLKPVKRITQLMYLIKLTLWHKYLRKRKWLRSIVRKWKFYGHMKALSKQKMTNLYKSMQLTYLQTAEQVIGNEENGMLGSEIEGEVTKRDKIDFKITSTFSETTDYLKYMK